MKTRYVYYKEETGEVREIRSDKSESGLPFITCPIDEVIDILSFKASTNEYIVAYNRTEDKHLLMKKDNVIRLRKQSKEPIKIPYEEDTINELTIIYYSGNTLEIVLDPASICPLYQTDFKQEVIFERGTEFRIIVKEKNSDKIFNEYIIDAQELLDNGQVYLELDKDVSSDNVEFLTYKLLNSYSWHKENSRLISPVKKGRKFDIHRADTKIRDDDFLYHLIIEQDKQQLKISNNIKNLHYIRFEKEIEFYIVDKLDPNILHGKFSLNEEQLKQNEIFVDFEYSLKGKTILYNHKYISLLIKE